LLGSVGAREPKRGAQAAEELMNGDRIELLAIVSLESENGETELCANIGEESMQNGENLRLLTHGERPDIMCKTIK